MDLTKIVYLCSGTRSGLEVIGEDQRNRQIRTTEDDNTVTVEIPLAPVGAEDNTDVNVSVGLLRHGWTWADKYDPDFTQRLASDDLDAPYWFNAITFDFDIPEGCDWQESLLARNLSAAPFAWVRPPVGLWEIPDSKSDVPMVKEWYDSLTSTVPIPGDRLDLRHLYRLAGQINRGPLWFHTEHFCGGVVVARRAHSVIPNLLVYDVEAEGQTLTDILPTDYYLYDIGEIVFPFVVGDTRSTTVPGFPSGSFRLAPLQLGDRGQSAGLSYLNFYEYANLRVLVGSVVSVAESANSAVVAINGSEYNISIVYHCVDQSTTDGHLAFVAGDAALILWSGYRSNLSAADMVIIGHLGYVYPCTATTTTTTTTSTTSTTTSSTSTTAATTTTTTTTTLPPTTTANPMLILWDAGDYRQPTYPYGTLFTDAFIVPAWNAIPAMAVSFLVFGLTYQRRINRYANVYINDSTLQCTIYYQTYVEGMWQPERSQASIRRTAASGPAAVTIQVYDYK